MFGLVELDLAKKRKLAGTVGERLRVLLAERGESVVWLADQMGMKRPSVSRILHDRSTNLTIATLRQFATVFDVTVGELVDEPGG